MLLKDIYARDISRDINPAVVVSNKDKETIEAEIKEYVFTKELIEKLYLIVDLVFGSMGITVLGNHILLNMSIIYWM